MIKASTIKNEISKGINQPKSKENSFYHHLVKGNKLNRNEKKPAISKCGLKMIDIRKSAKSWQTI